MLGPGRYLLGVAEVLLIAGLAWLAATRLRDRLLPTLTGPAAALAALVLACALAIWPAQLLGTVDALAPLPYLLLLAATAAAIRLLVPAAGIQPAGAAPAGGWHGARGRERTPRPQVPRPMTGPVGPAGPRPSAPLGITVASLTIAALALAHFAWEARSALGTGMTGFDTTWYHAPFAAGFAESGDTFSLHFIAPQFLAWFYPANAELPHALGMLAFGRDLLSPLLNVGWFGACLLACWCVGRPYGAAPWSLAFGAIALSVPALSDQAGEARNDIVGIFFLLAASALLLDAFAARRRRGEAVGLGAVAVVGLAAGLAAGTKLNFLLPAAVLVLGLPLLVAPAARRRALGIGIGAALAGGGYWYLRNLVHSGNPLPWVDSLGPIPLPAPDQALGGREANSVLGYLFDGAVWTEWLLPGLRDGLWVIWPLLLGAALAGLVLALIPPRGEEGEGRPAGRLGWVSSDMAMVLAGLAGLAAALAWLVTPTSASGPDGSPRGFESGLRYLAPALVLGLALLPATPRLRAILPSRSRFLTAPGRDRERSRAGARGRARRGALALGLAGAVLLATAIGYPVQRHYLENRYADPAFATPGLNAAFAWARDVDNARIATTSTRQYPLFGTDLSNTVEFVGETRPHGGFEAPATCRRFRRLLAGGSYDYVVASLDRLEPGKRRYPEQAAWTAGPWAEVVLRTPPTVVFRLTGDPDPASCPR